MEITIDFISEEELRQQFVKMYLRKKNILAYQLENKARHGGIDMVTVERVPDSEDNTGFHIELCSFEFKLNDINKAFSQANSNSKYFHKSFIVVPMKKKKLIEQTYSTYYKSYPNIGCIGVNHPSVGGTYEMFHKAKAKADDQVLLNQAVLKLCLKQI